MIIWTLALLTILLISPLLEVMMLCVVNSIIVETISNSEWCMCHTDCVRNPNSKI